MFKTRFLSMLVLLCLTVSGAWAGTTIVTWTSSGSYENNNSRGGVTLLGDVVEYDSSVEEWTLAFDTEQGTFTTSLGNFTSIVISGGYISGFEGTGWNGRTWTGNASSVPFSGYLTDSEGGEPWTITFTIASPEPVTGVTLAPTTATLTLGETETVTLTAYVLPDNATDKSVTWSSSNTSVATVSNSGVVTAVGAGTAIITVTATNGTDVTSDDQTATCTVTVAAPAPAWVRDGDTWDDATKTLTVNSNPVDFAYSNASDIENLVISDAVTSIGQSAFAECTGLTSITIPNNVISIGVGAFAGCI